MKKITLFHEISAFINSLDVSTISEKRKKTLQPLIDFVQSKVSNQETVAINFICTHNSRRSHLSQVCAQTIAYSLHISNVICYSGGTEATAMFPMAAKKLENSGFQIQTLSEGKNPVYAIKYAENAHPIMGFSKRLDDDFNPKTDFAAIMTCNSANEACPLVLGAEKRIPITFEDPKAFDNTPQQAEKYHERSVQIATELLYVFSQLKKEHE